MATKSAGYTVQKEFASSSASVLAWMCPYQKNMLISTQLSSGSFLPETTM